MPDIDAFGLETVSDLAGLEAVREVVREVRVSPTRSSTTSWTSCARRASDPRCSCGASPRAANMLASASRALAAVLGRDFVIPDDVKRLAAPALAHRVVLAPAAEIEGLDARAAIRQVVDGVPAPR